MEPASWAAPTTPRPAVSHELKTWPGYFQAVLSGQKTFEIRRNDRYFQAGDSVLLREWDPAPDRQDYTGRELAFRIGFVYGGICVTSTEPDHVAFSLLRVCACQGYVDDGGSGDVTWDPRCTMHRRAEPEDPTAEPPF